MNNKNVAKHALGFIGGKIDIIMMMNQNKLIL